MTREDETHDDETRTVNVVVPEETYWHVRRCATASKMSMKDFMNRFCLEARPYSDGGENAEASGAANVSAAPVSGS